MLREPQLSSESSMKTAFVTRVTLFAALLCLPFVFSACHKSTPTIEAKTPVEAETTTAEEERDVQVDLKDSPELAAALKGGAQLWAENCMRCHNYRRPRERSDREWDVIVLHMRVRANLTANEHRQIARFLKSAN